MRITEPRQVTNDMKKLSRTRYLAWARDVATKTVAAPTVTEVMAATRVRMVEAGATHEGALIRIVAQGGGFIDLMLNAAQAFHLVRSLSEAGRGGGWATPDGNADTDPRLDPDLDPLNIPPGHQA